MLASLAKFLFAVFFTIAAITLISFIGDKAVTAKDLDKDAVIIEVKTEPTPIVEIASDTSSNEAEPKPDEIKEETPPAPVSIESILANADIAKGAKLSKKCAACHSFNEGGKNKIGPNLWNIVGSNKAAKEGFKYSKALASFGGNWDYISLDKFLLKPKKFISGTKMSFAGVKKIEERAALIAWIRTQADEPHPLPSE